ncbi:unannotated protein [freshwater metagenome]|uniref:Unannotated protein n=1 Tax=freshwater metagenome TaxID=449393 RepID=A0A6J7ENC5_9ZZZZ
MFVKVIDIDLERRRISLSLKQANEGEIGEIIDFDPTAYGMAANYDAEGNYVYPEGFDPDTGEWLPGYEAAQVAWEAQYAEAQKRFEANKAQMAVAQKADAEAAEAEPTTFSSEDGDKPEEGALASDAALAELREKLTSADSQ